MSDDFARKVLRVVVGKACQPLGVHGIQSGACETMADVLKNYILTLAKTTTAYSVHANRTDPNLADLEQTFHHLGVDLCELSDFVKQVESSPLDPNIPRFPVPRNGSSHIYSGPSSYGETCGSRRRSRAPSLSSEDEEPDPIPSHFPPLPCQDDTDKDEDSRSVSMETGETPHEGIAKDIATPTPLDPLRGLPQLFRPRGFSSDISEDGDTSGSRRNSTSERASSVTPIRANTPDTFLGKEPSIPEETLTSGADKGEEGKLSKKSETKDEVLTRRQEQEEEEIAGSVFVGVALPSSSSSLLPPSPPQSAPSESAKSQDKTIGISSPAQSSFSQLEQGTLPGVGLGAGAPPSLSRPPLPSLPISKPLPKGRVRGIMPPPPLRLMSPSSESPGFQHPNHSPLAFSPGGGRGVRFGMPVLSPLHTPVRSLPNPVATTAVAMNAPSLTATSTTPPDLSSNNAHLINLGISAGSSSSLVQQLHSKPHPSTPPTSVTHSPEPDDTLIGLKEEKKKEEEEEEEGEMALLPEAPIPTPLSLSPSPSLPISEDSHPFKFPDAAKQQKLPLRKLSVDIERSRRSRSSTSSSSSSAISPTPIPAPISVPSERHLEEPRSVLEGDKGEEEDDFYDGGGGGGSVRVSRGGGGGDGRDGEDSDGSVHVTTGGGGAGVHVTTDGGGGGVHVTTSGGGGGVAREIPGGKRIQSSMDDEFTKDDVLEISSSDSSSSLTPSPHPFPVRGGKVMSVTPPSPRRDEYLEEMKTLSSDSEQLEEEEERGMEAEDKQRSSISSEEDDDEDDDDEESKEMFNFEQEMIPDRLSLSPSPSSLTIPPPSSLTTSSYDKGSPSIRSHFVVTEEVATLDSGVGGSGFVAKETMVEGGSPFEEEDSSIVQTVIGGESSLSDDDIVQSSAKVNTQSSRDRDPSILPQDTPNILDRKYRNSSSDSSEEDTDAEFDRSHGNSSHGDGFLDDNGSHGNSGTVMPESNVVVMEKRTNVTKTAKRKRTDKGGGVANRGGGVVHSLRSPSAVIKIEKVVTPKAATLHCHSNRVTPLSPLVVHVNRHMVPSLRKAKEASHFKTKAEMKAEITPLAVYKATPTVTPPPSVQASSQITKTEPIPLKISINRRFLNRSRHGLATPTSDDSKYSANRVKKLLARFPASASTPPGGLGPSAPSFPPPPLPPPPLPPIPSPNAQRAANPKKRELDMSEIGFSPSSGGKPTKRSRPNPPIETPPHVPPPAPPHPTFMDNTMSTSSSSSSSEEDDEEEDDSGSDSAPSATPTPPPPPPQVPHHTYPSRPRTPSSIDDEEDEAILTPESTTSSIGVRGGGLRLTISKAILPKATVQQLKVHESKGHHRHHRQHSSKKSRKSNKPQPIPAANIPDLTIHTVSDRTIKVRMPKGGGGASSGGRGGGVSGGRGSKGSRGVHSEKKSKITIPKKQGVVIPAGVPPILQGSDTICPECGLKDDGSPMIGCDGCDSWVHWVCGGITAAPPEDQKWYCPDCRKAGYATSAESSSGKKRGRKKKKQ